MPLTPIRQMLLALLILLFVVFPKIVSATPPALLEVFIDRETLLVITRSYFPGPVVEQLATILSQTTDSKRPPRLSHPYGAAFSYLGSGYDVISVLSPILEYSVAQNMPANLTEFLNVINQDPVIRGMIRSKDYSGCLMVIINAQHHSQLEVTYKSNSYPGCNNHGTKPFQRTFGLAWPFEP